MKIAILYVAFLLKRFLSECDPLDRPTVSPKSFMMDNQVDPWLRQQDEDGRGEVVSEH